MNKFVVMTPEQVESLVERTIQRALSTVRQDMAHKNPAGSLTPMQAADYLGQSPNTLRQWRSQGRGPAYEKRGRSVRYSMDDLEIWRNAGRVVTGEDLESRHVGRSRRNPGQLFPSEEGSHA